MASKGRKERYRRASSANRNKAAFKHLSQREAELVKQYSDELEKRGGVMIGNTANYFNNNQLASNAKDAYWTDKLISNGMSKSITISEIEKSIQEADSKPFSYNKGYRDSEYLSKFNSTINDAVDNANKASKSGITPQNNLPYRAVVNNFTNAVNNSNITEYDKELILNEFKKRLR